jgi:hypothetical protein
MFDDDDIIEIRRFEVGAIVNNNRYTIKTTNDVEEATIAYERATHSYRNVIDYVIIFMFDYDKGTNVNYYDSEVD